MMKCEKITGKIYQFVDGELEEEESAAVSGHVSDCASCAALLEEERKLDAVLKKSVREVEVPYGLAGRIFPEPEPAIIKRKFRMGFRRRLKPALVPLAAVLFLGALLFPLAFPRFDAGALLGEAAASHAGFISGERGLDFVSGDVSEISGWLEERLDFGVSIPDLSAAGFRPAGARLCMLGGQKAGCAVYEREGLYVSVFMKAPARVGTAGLDRISAEGKAFYSGVYGGHNCVLCLEEGHGAVCLYVSDLPGEELLEIAKAGRE